MTRWTSSSSIIRQYITVNMITDSWNECRFTIRVVGKSLNGCALGQIAERSRSTQHVGLVVCVRLYKKPLCGLKNNLSRRLNSSGLDTIWSIDNLTDGTQIYTHLQGCEALWLQTRISSDYSYSHLMFWIDKSENDCKGASWSSYVVFRAVWEF